LNRIILLHRSDDGAGHGFEDAGRFSLADGVGGGDFFDELDAIH
jgi:hypothetical protein